MALARAGEDAWICAPPPPAPAAPFVALACEGPVAARAAWTTGRLIAAPDAAQAAAIAEAAALPTAGVELMGFWRAGAFDEAAFAAATSAAAIAVGAEAGDGPAVLALAGLGEWLWTQVSTTTATTGGPPLATCSSWRTTPSSPSTSTCGSGW